MDGFPNNDASHKRVGWPSYNLVADTTAFECFINSITSELSFGPKKSTPWFLYLSFNVFNSGPSPTIFNFKLGVSDFKKEVISSSTPFCFEILPA